MILLNKRFNDLKGYPFKRLNDLLRDISPIEKKNINDMSIGQPLHNPPAFIKEILSGSFEKWKYYPPTNGILELRIEYVRWLRRRFKLPKDFLCHDKNVLSLSGTREGLFSIALAINPPTVILPNPFYQVYLGASIAINSKLQILNTSKKTNYLYDLEELDKVLSLNENALVYFCSPSNPQGAAASLEYWKKIIRIVRKRNAVLIADECYSDIYTMEKPVGILEACITTGNSLSNILAFHSLSKRSNLAGIRSGFVVGDPSIISLFSKMRSYSAPTIPLPLQDVSIELWRDEKHVKENRLLYKEKFDYAEKVLSKKNKIIRPDGGFYLWLEVDSGVETAKKIWKKTGIKVMPGSYLSLKNKDIDPGINFIRIALVAEPSICNSAIKRISGII